MFYLPNDQLRSHSYSQCYPTIRKTNIKLDKAYLYLTPSAQRIHLKVLQSEARRLPTLHLNTVQIYLYIYPMRYMNYVMHTQIRRKTRCIHFFFYQNIYYRSSVLRREDITIVLGPSVINRSLH